MSEIPANWAAPVSLAEIEAEVNVMEDELKSLDGWPFLILRSKAGVGKTYSPMVWAKRNVCPKCKEEGAQNQWVHVFIQECSGDMGRYDLVGSNIIGNGGGFEFQAGQVSSAIRWAQMGHRTMLIMDEVNLLPPATVKSINSAFDFRHAVDTPVGRFEAGQNLLIVGTCNSEKESAGFDLDDSFQSRAVIVTLNAGDIADRFLKLGKLDEDTASLIRATDGAFSLREAQQQVALAKVYGDAKAMQMVTSKYVNEDKKKLVQNAVLQVWGPVLGAKLVRK